MIKTIAKIIIGIGFFFFVDTLHASAAQYYVSKSGQDSYTGLVPTYVSGVAGPFLTVQKALDIVSAGDTVNILSGIYSEGLVLKTTGTNSQKITLRNYNDAEVTVNSGDVRAVRLGGVIGYYIFQGLTFTSNYVGAYAGDKDYSVDLGIGSSWWGWGFPALDDNGVTYTAGVDDDSNGNNGFVIDHCTINGSIGLLGHGNVVQYSVLNGGGAFSNGIHDMTVVSHGNTWTHNTISNYTDRGIWSMSNTYANHASYNDISHWGVRANPAAIDFDGAWLPVYSSTMSNNTIHDGDGANSMGMQFENCMNCVAENNLIYNVAQGMTSINYDIDSARGTCTDGWYCYGFYDFRVQDDSHLVMGSVPYQTNNLFKNNIIHDTTSVGILLNMSWGSYIYNNTIYRNTAGHGAILLANGGTTSGSFNTEIKNNIMAQNNIGVNVEAYSSISSQANNLFHGNASNGTVGAAAIIANPLFNNEAAQDFTLQSGSPAINAGNSVQIVSADFSGISRPQGGAYDIGAHEFSSASPAAPTGLAVQ